MTYKAIPIFQLVVNPNNDRHGPQGSEKDAIAWLFKNKPIEMRGLAKDIAYQKEIFDAPLVKKIEGKYVVYDGNRRTTCLKLIHTPTNAPQKFVSFFEELHSEAASELPKSIECQIEVDQGKIDRILERRHNGKLSGEGQIKWDTRAKANHANRMGGKTSYPIVEKVETYLTEKGYPNASKIQRSTFAKIADTVERRSRIGIDLDSDGNLSFTNDEKYVYPLLVKLADDIISGDLSLVQLLRTKDKNDYLSGLEKQGFTLSEPNPNLNGNKSGGGRPASGKNPPTRKPKLRRTLVPQDIEYDMDWSAGQAKIKELWSQLNYQLKFDTHDFSIAVVFRVFLEQITASGVNKFNLSEKGALHKDISVTSSKLLELGKYDRKQHDDIVRKVGDKQSLSSIESLQRALHSKSDMPAKSDLVSLWDCLEPYILGLLKR